MTTVAKRYDMSDNGLRKHCKRLGVPMPLAGYWSKIRAGQKVHYFYILWGTILDPGWFFYFPGGWAMLGSNRAPGQGIRYSNTSSRLRGEESRSGIFSL